jgi:hypothetical protein
VTRWTALALALALTACSKEVFVKATKVGDTLVIEVKEDALIGSRTPCLTAVSVQELPSGKRVWLTNVSDDRLCEKRGQFRYGERFMTYQLRVGPQVLQPRTWYRVYVSSTGGGHGSVRIRF